MNRKGIIAIGQCALVVALGTSQLHDVGSRLASAIAPARTHAATTLALLRAPQLPVPVLQAALPAAPALPTICNRQPKATTTRVISFGPSAAQLAKLQAAQVRFHFDSA